MAYRCVATSVAGFVQQLAVSYIANGYYFYVAGQIPDGKDPARTDQKLIRQYGIDVSKWTRARRKKQGLARVQYLRYRSFFVLLATHGQHPFFTLEARQLRDIREHPLYFRGYSIGCRRARGGGAYHASVRIEGGECRNLKAYFEEIATRQSVEEISRALGALDYAPYAPVQAQKARLLRAVNRRRQLAGLERVPRPAIWQFRIPVRPFD